MSVIMFAAKPWFCSRLSRYTQQRKRKFHFSFAKKPNLSLLKVGQQTICSWPRLTLTKQSAESDSKSKLSAILAVFIAGNLMQG
jgi:hypothetical protein